MQAWKGAAAVQSQAGLPLVTARASAARRGPWRARACGGPAAWPAAVSASLRSNASLRLHAAEVAGRAAKITRHAGRSPRTTMLVLGRYDEVSGVPARRQRGSGVAIYGRAHTCDEDGAQAQRPSVRVVRDGALVCGGLPVVLAALLVHLCGRCSAGARWRRHFDRSNGL
jgi:hypothetical protein